MGWYIIYPIGITAVMLLQSLVKHMDEKLPYNKSFKMDAAKRRGAL